MPVSHAFENVPLLLATGQGRSGTTVLTKSLAAHPEIYSNLVESNVLNDVCVAGRNSSTMPSRIRQMVLPREQHDLVFRRMLLDLLFPADRWDGEHPPSTLSTFSAMTPEAAEFAITVFPGIHFANIVRHGVEVVASRMVHRTLGQQSFEDHCHAWANAQQMAEWGADRPEFTLVRQEHLLKRESCERAFATLFSRAGVREDSACTDYVMEHRYNQTRYDGEPDENNADLSTRIERWNKWSDRQRDTFVKICGPTMDYFGYPIPG